MRSPEATGAIRHTAAGVALFDAAGRLLLVHQNYGKRHWDFPGGIAEADESPEETAIRETREEVGLTVTPRGLIGVYFTRPEARHVFIFRAAYAGEAITLQMDELDDYRWCVSDGLPPLTAWKHRQVLDAFTWTGMTMMRTRD